MAGYNFLRELETKCDEIMRSMVELPPSTWDEFNKRLGAWSSLKTMLDEANDALRRKEEQDDDR